MKDQKQTNKEKYSDVTVADVKGCKGYENISDELAQGIADAIRVYTEIVYNGFREGRFAKQQAKVISLAKKENKNAA